MSSIGKLMKQAARMQKQMAEVQEQLAERTVEATSGGGAVRAVARCNGTLADLEIQPEAVNPDDTALLQDMIVTAVNGALAKAQEISAEEMGKLTGGLGGMPGLM